ASCKDINQAGLGKSGELIIASEENRIELISCINNYSYDIPMVLATEYDNSHAYEINENELARRLSGFAYVVVADKAFIDSIKKEINAKLYNGTVVVYHKGEYKLLRKENKLFGASLDEFVFQHIREHSQSIILPQKTNEAVSDSKEIEELKKQLIKEKEKNARLSMELNEAKNENKALAEALENAKNNEFAIIKPKELYEGEIIDLIHSVCAEAKKSLNPIQKRKIDLIDEMLALNPRAENGKMFFNKFKGIFYNGVDLKGSDFAKLEKQGFKCERERGHYIFIYDKYRFVTAKSTSDDKSGKNLYSDFRSILCVY
ncbi:MAG: hypothetical protein J6A53_09550, partial [Clostridia bacterium]|nr:hypothetical protein [Clostridia bacterium]